MQSTPLQAPQLLGQVAPMVLAFRLCLPDPTYAYSLFDFRLDVYIPKPSESPGKMVLLCFAFFPVPGSWQQIQRMESTMTCHGAEPNTSSPRGVGFCKT